MNVKGSIIDVNNRLNRVFPSFIPFSSELLPRNRLIDIYPSFFSFHSIDKSKDGRKEHIQKLNNLTLQVSDASKIAIVISNISIKNQVATLIAHIHIYDNPVIKTLHHAVNIMSTEAKLFAIRWGINQATQLANINCIVIIMDLLHAAKQIFDSLVHQYQIHSAIISGELRKFFIRDQQSSIKFLECPSYDKWMLHDIVNKETKKFDLISIFLCKSSWKFNRKNKYNEILNNWKMTFQASDDKRRYFLDLLDNDLNSIELTYSKGGSWLKFFGHSNSLYTRVTRAITNHAPIGEY